MKKTPQKVAYLWQLRGFFFSAAPTAQKSPKLHFHFINYFIQSSLLRSLVGRHMSVKTTYNYTIIQIHILYFINRIWKTLDKSFDRNGHWHSLFKTSELRWVSYCSFGSFFGQLYNKKK